MSLYTSLNIGRQALHIGQLGLQIAGQNIANVNTAGYKRQRMEQVNLPYGLGVTVQSIDRVRSTFAEKQLLGITSDAASSSLTAQAYSDIENIFNEMTGSGLDSELNDFFKALQDLAAQPGGTAERATLRSSGESLSSMFSFLQDKMSEEVRNQDLDLDNMVSTANGLIDEIANLNKRIGAGVGNELGVNELRNNRDEAVRKLAELMPVTTNEDMNGNYTVYIKNGMPLLAGAEPFHLQAVPDVTNDLKRNIQWVSDSAVQDVTSQMTSGKIGGVLINRDVNIPEQQEKLDRLAAEFILGFNEQHRAGVGLDGVGNRNFFEATPVFTHVGQGNEGGAEIAAATITDESALTLDKYEVRFSANGGGMDYTVVDTTTGATVSTGAYVSGAAIAFDGISVTVNDASGPPHEGDFFRVDTITGAASNLNVSAAITASTDAIGAGFSSASGDNRNALAMADLENKAGAGTNMSTLEKYHAMIVELGVAAASEDTQNESRDTLLSQGRNMVESVSGVNLDEETTSLMQYQHAYQAAAKLISTVDEMLRNLMEAV